MSATCCHHDHDAHAAGRYRRVLWAALAVNAAMFATEVAASLFAGSVSLLADALDFLGDASSYALSLFVLAMGLAARARAGLIKGLTMGGFGLYVLAAAVWHSATGTVPEPFIMGPVAILALAANLGVAALLYSHRNGDSNRRSVWLCSRNDAIANVAVILAAGGVWATQSGWPDIAVAAGIAALSLSASWSVVRQARGELAHVRAHAQGALAAE